MLPLAVAIALLAFPRLGLGLTYLVFITVLGLGYEWTHYLIHSDYKPKSSLYKAIWRNHRQHHSRTSTTGTPYQLRYHRSRAGHLSPSGAVPTSPTTKNLHASGVSH